MSGFDDAGLVARRSARLRALLGEADAPARPLAFPAARIAQAARRRAFRRGRIAAGIALVALTAVGVSPVRAWIVGAARTVWARFAAVPRPPVTVAPGAVPPPPATVGAVTVPAGDALSLTVARRQASGTVSLVVEDRQTVSAEVAGESGTADVQVSASGIRIENRAEASGHYTVRIPARLSRVTVQIGREAPRTLRIAPAQRWDFDLAVRTGARRALQQ
jgi:hypothetical protein